MKTCPYCGNEIDDTLNKCPFCNRSLINAPTAPKKYESNRYTCSKCGKKVLKTWIIKSNTYCETCLENLLRDVILTTTPSIEGYNIIEYLGVDTAEVVLGTGLLSEISTDFQDFFGGRSTSFELKLANAKSLALQKIQAAALKKGANAIVGVDIDYTEFTGNRIGIIISGTSVKISKIEP